MSVSPNFLIIGAPQSATTSLWDLLRQHPDIFMSKLKEPAFFSDDEVFARGWNWYESLFVEGSGKTAIGEATSHYCNVESYPNTPERIAKYLPNVKLIYSVRHPLERMESAWLQCLRTGHPMPRSFSRAVREYNTIIECTHYWHNISAYRRCFSDDQILVIFFEDFRKNPEKILEKCYRFLCVDPTVKAQDAKVPRNVKVGAYMKRPSFSTLYSIPGSEYLRKVVPIGMKNVFKSWGMVSLPPRPKWDEQTRKWALEQVREDANEILKYGGKTEDYWNLRDELV